MSKPAVKQSDPEKFDVFPEQLELFDPFPQLVDDIDPTDQSIPDWEIEILGRDSDGR